MLAFRDLSQLIARNTLIAIKLQPVFGFTWQSEDRKRKRPVVDAVDFLRQRARGERCVQSGSAEAKYRGHRQHHGNQGNEAQHTQTELAP